MDPTEIKMINAEVVLIKSKIKNAKIFIIVFFAFASIWFWIWNSQESPYSILNNSINIVLISFLLLFIYAVSKKIITTRNDIKNQIKITDELKVTNKYKDYEQNGGVRFFITLDSKIIKKYEVTENVFNDLNINDSVYIEYSKYANWILKIEHNGIDIENKQMIT
ncbi:hypothetical protein K5V07_12135 [Flavobacterium sp. CHNK8]|uniref:hypothetical protein n=1 Tax=Flavobacterium sp. CHNK8 TaxID=2871165 RepID=UPI001C8D72B9|nr:hypothetical protein [Flavobacterium sp. CHNK8]QZK91198.1 hypothetical protein K5V07_12135 [Flavobacterium sp. CHNK8]